MEDPLAYEQIKDAVMNYFWQIDMKNIDGVMACFHDGAVVNFLDSLLEGLTAIREFYTVLLEANPHMKHIAYSAIVDNVVGDEAHARVRYYADGSGEGAFTWGYSLLGLKRKNGVWLITSYDAKLWPTEK